MPAASAPGFSAQAAGQLPIEPRALPPAYSMSSPAGDVMAVARGLLADVSRPSSMRERVILERAVPQLVPSWAELS